MTVSLAFARYLAVGVLATGVHYLTLLMLVEATGLAAPVSAVLGAAAGALAAYAGNWHLTFARCAAHLQALPRFLIVAGSGAIANGLIVWAGTRHAGMHYLAAQSLASVLVAGVSFAANRAWTFQ